jgi:hypothetical protein
MRSDVNKLKVKADEYHLIHSKLLLILSEGPNNSKKLVEDYEAIIRLKNELNLYYNTHIQELEARDKIIEINEHNPEFDKFMQKYSNLIYLSTITVHTLWLYYSDIIH